MNPDVCSIQEHSALLRLGPEGAFLDDEVSRSGARNSTVCISNDALHNLCLVTQHSEGGDRILAADFESVRIFFHFSSCTETTMNNSGICLPVYLSSGTLIPRGALKEHCLNFLQSTVLAVSNVALYILISYAEWEIGDVEFCHQMCDGDSQT